MRGAGGVAAGIGAAGRIRALRAALDPAQMALLLALLSLLTAFILYPLIQVLAVALTADGHLSLVHLRNFFARPLFREALANSLLAGFLAVLFGSLLGVPLAYFSVRLQFRGRLLLQTLGVLPLVIPPFVGAVAFQQILGRSGMVNLLLLQTFGTTVPFMEGLAGVVLVQSLHYFPFIMLNTAAALANLDPSLEEMAQNMGCHGFRLFRRVTLPLVLPGYVAGALLVFIRVVDDLGTPLMLNYTKLLAPQAYLRITTVGLNDVDGYVICVIMVALSLLALWGARGYLSLGEYATVQRGTTGASLARPVAGWRLLLVWGVSGSLLALALLPHLGIAILSFARIWSYSVLPAQWTLGNYGEILFRTPHFVRNTLVYSLLAAGIDVLLGAAIAFLLVRGKVLGRNALDAVATMPLAIPGVVLAVGYLRVFHGWDVPGLGEPLTASWLILVVAYSMRRLPYTVRACDAAMRQIHASLEEAAMNLGSNRRRTFFKVTFPLMLGGLMAGGLIAFITSSVELSSTIMLVPRMEMGPLAYGIYIYMQSAVGRGPGAALGVVAILLVAGGTYALNRVFSRGTGTAFKL
ncbi:MAG: iron ABC transporter permease [candidate division NC10 bacterium]|nr:iron ABC transporter permease [candidate division NC10 bacterium]